MHTLSIATHTVVTTIKVGSVESVGLATGPHETKVSNRFEVEPPR
jgi:hypothetical protein